MKATLDLPDELYRRVKARSAMEGRPVRSIAMQLFQDWLEAPAVPAVTRNSTPPAMSTAEKSLPSTRFDHAPWLAIARKHIKPGMSHDMNGIRAAIAQGWAAEVGPKLKLSPSDD